MFVNLPANFEEVDLNASVRHASQNEDRTEKVEGSGCQKCVEETKSHKRSQCLTELATTAFLWSMDNDLLITQFDSLTCADLAALA